MNEIIVHFMLVNNYPMLTGFTIPTTVTDARGNTRVLTKRERLKIILQYLKRTLPTKFKHCTKEGCKDCTQTQKLLDCVEYLRGE